MEMGQDSKSTQISSLEGREGKKTGVLSRDEKSDDEDGRL